MAYLRINPIDGKPIHPLFKQVPIKDNRSIRSEDIIQIITNKKTDIHTKWKKFNDYIFYIMTHMEEMMEKENFEAKIIEERNRLANLVGLMPKEEAAYAKKIVEYFSNSEKFFKKYGRRYPLKRKTLIKSSSAPDINKYFIPTKKKTFMEEREEQNEVKEKIKALPKVELEKFNKIKKHMRFLSKAKDPLAYEQNIYIHPNDLIEIK